MQQNNSEAIMSDLNKLYDQINEENRPHLEGAGFPH